MSDSTSGKETENESLADWTLVDHDESTEDGVNHEEGIEQIKCILIVVNCVVHTYEITFLKKYLYVIFKIISIIYKYNVINCL